MNKRRHSRLNASGMEVDIADRVGFSTGTIKDISRFGVCITDIPRKLQTQNDSFTAVITGNGRRFRLQLQPKWVEEDGLTTTTGAIITNAPWDWTAMLIELEPKDEDIWTTH